MLKKLVNVALFLISLLFIIVNDASTAQTRFSLALREGFGSMKIGDLNTTLESYNNNPALEDTRQYYPDRCIGEFLPIKDRFTHWEAEIRSYIWGGFSLGISIEEKTHFSGQSSLLYTIVDYPGTQTMNQTLTSDIDISSPIRFHLYYSRHILAGFHLYANGGIGFYRARMRQDQDWYNRFPSSAIQVIENYWDVKGKCRGYHYGIGLEYRMNKRMSLLAEARWIQAKIETLSGEAQQNIRFYNPEGTLTETVTHTNEGPLFHYIGEDLDYGGWHEKLIVNEEIWQVGTDGPYGIRQAFLDLSGFTLRIGLKIGLF
ncbi:MAG TPA: outer membrane beta-barrel protein [Candidatus Aminicenantes bacterium]|nr:outer membrane beta-barrel protein [Candidatus Aminicenantes bacterium]HRY65026.1 outer membrane beta-barrel protein [Candidatus Aminicenantes bacterium]HRZ71939.1 outer membrane beta-barrel protein [Candidatus Aminicenantes bacterium]